MPPRSRPTPASRPSSPASTTTPRRTWPICSRTRPTTVHRKPTPSCLAGIVPLPIDPERVPAEGDPPWRLLEERRLDPRPPLPPRLPAHQRLPRQSHRSGCLPDVGLGRDPPRLPRPLRRRWRQAPHHPRRPGHAGRRHGEPGDARPAVAGLLPEEDLAPPRDRAMPSTARPRTSSRSRTPASGPTSR